MSQLMSRRKVLMGSAALLGAGALQGLPVPGLMRSALADLPRPDYMIRASSNENPYGPSRVALQAIAESLRDANKYTGINDEMTALMSKLEQVPEECIAIGSGSGELLKVGGLIGSLAGGSIVCPDPTFEGLMRYADNMGTEVIRVPVDENMHTDLEAMYNAIRPDTRMVYVCNPNNPIPSIIEKNALRDFVLTVAQDRMVFIDEAYHEFVDDPEYASMMSLIREGHKNIIISRTASKIHGLAALRVGFAFAHPEIAADINQKMTGQLNLAGMKAAYASYQDMDFQAYTLQKNRESLDMIEAMCKELGIRYIPSHTNFTFIETGRDIREVSAAFREAGVLIGRPFAPYTNWARISMPKPEEMAYLIEVYKRLYA
jgi:histidinol-phosphate aminotransferase